MAKVDLMDKIWQAYQNLPGWARAVIALIIVSVLVWAGWTINKSIKAAKASADKNAQKKDVSDATNKTLNDLAASGVNPTLSSYQATSTCNTIQSLLDGCQLSGTEKVVVDTILQAVQNQADWVLLAQTWGVRELDNCGPWTGSTSYDFKSCLSNQLASVDWSFTTYLTVLKDELKAKGITF